MKTARLRIDLPKITRNARAVLAICRSHGMGLMGVTKGVCGDPHVARAMLEAGVKTLGDARLDNVVRMREAGIDAPITLIRSPAPSEAADCVYYADGSLNSDRDVVKALSSEAARAGKVHRVVLMVDFETGREGFHPDDIADVFVEASGLPGLAIEGIGLYLDYQSDDDFVIEKQQAFVALARRITTEHAIDLPILSGGSTNVFRRVLKGRVVEGINQLRIGTSILLGIASSLGPIVIDDLEQDTFLLDVELIEVKPRGKRIGLLPVGKLDAPKEQLFPVRPEIAIVDQTSDHTMLDLTGAQPLPRTGDTVSFRLGYSALNRLMASRYVVAGYR